MNPTLEIFSQGEEIVTGQIADTNAAWLSQQAVRLGFTVTRHTAVGDKLDDLIGLLREIAERADCCICTGGLGPTSDDLTAEAVALAFDLPLIFDEIAFAQIKRFFTNRNRVMPESNRKQAMLPKGAERLDNEWGTAPGFALQYGRCRFAFIPGVPSEMQHLFLEKILPTLHQRFSLQPEQLVTIKTIGIGESAIQERLNTIAIPDRVQLGFRAGPEEVQTKLLFPADYPEPAMTALVNQVAERLGKAVFAIDKPGEAAGDLVSVIDKLMSGKHTLAVIETASHGLLSSLCIGRNWLLTASYDQNMARLGQQDNEHLINTTQTLAANLQKSSGADIILVQLYAGDDNALHDKDRSIAVYTGLLSGENFEQASHSIGGSIKRKQTQAALLSLDLLRRYLQDQP